jgi:subtilisin family serine protease
MGTTPVVVAVLDSGVDATHPDLQGRLEEGYNAVDCTNTPNDDSPVSHGTRVAGIIAAVGNNNATVPNSIAGVAWTAPIRILPCKCIGSGATVQDCLTCLNFVKQKADGGMRIAAINMSWETPKEDGLDDAIAVFGPAPGAAKGSVVVAAAGNGGYDLVQAPVYPAASAIPNLITVTAMLSNGTTASDSNRSRYRAHLQAPGDQILATIIGGGYDDLGKTSMAAPHVAGVAALLVSREPQLDWLAVRNRILASARPDGSETITHGHLDAHKALTSTRVVMVRRLTPVKDTASATPNVLLSVLSINGDGPADPNKVTVKPASLGIAPIELKDDGVNLDVLSGDGVYTKVWSRTTPDEHQELELEFPDGSVVTLPALP